MRNGPHSCPRCGAALPAPEAVCERCLLTAALESADQPRLGPDYLDDLPLPRDAQVIAGKYTVLATIARGGMGVIYRARQHELNREVAVKMLLAGAHASEEFKQRFVQEAQSAARLHHPNIVTVHDWGEDNGQPYFSMEFIDGANLAEHVRKHPLPPAAAARLVEALAQAVQYAHAHGVLHRDLKPANVMIGSSGVPRLTDFGLARPLDAGTDLTVSGQVLGTPAYASPEQFSTRPESVGVISDVYGLGAILYFLLTGRPPFVAATVPEVLRALLETDPVTPRQLNPSTPRDLETICLKCLEKDPRRRYATATALEEDLQRWQEGKPIFARPTSPLERAAKWVKRHRTLAAAAAIIVLLSGAFFTHVVWSGQRAQRTVALLRYTAPFLEAEVNKQIAEFKFQAALTNLSALAGLFPEDARYPSGEGNLRETLLDFDGAQRAYERALDCPVHPQLHSRVRPNLELCRYILRQPKPDQLAVTNLFRLHSILYRQDRFAEAEFVRQWLPFFQDWKRQLRDVGWTDTSLKKFVLDHEGFLRVDAGGDAAVRNILPLARMPLKTLDLRRTTVTNLEPLRGLPLVDILLYKTPVRDLEPLTGMPMRRLDVEQSLVTDLSPIRGMSLEYLNLKGTKVSDLSPVTGMPLRDLNLERTSALTDLRPLSNSPVRFINLYQSAVTDIRPLTNCPRLEWLILPPGASNIHVLRPLPLKELSWEMTYTNGPLRPSMLAEKFWSRQDGLK